MFTELADFGFDSWFENLARELCQPGQQIARVTAVDRGRYMVRNGPEEIPAGLTGRFRYLAESPVDLPCVGDWVCTERTAASTEAAIIHTILPRKSFLRRKSAGKNIEFQMIAANIDAAFIVLSCHFDFNVRRLERYLVMVQESQIQPLILLTKIDLVSPDELQQLIAKIRNTGIGDRIIPISNVSEAGIEQLGESMAPGKTYCLLGSSGVGKTTLINKFTDGAGLKTGTVSGTGEGRHTTSRRQLIMLAQGAMLLDTPGMRELGILGAGEGIDDSFADIRELSSDCRFANCSHTNEPGCAVLRAIEQGELNREHHNNYVKIKKESDFHEMSYSQKRKKDKDFGRHVKSVMKHKKKKG